MKGGQTLKDRLLYIRRNAKLNQEDFAKKLGLTKNYISLVETGNRVPSDRTIKDICREFNVNEHWLRTGEGEMFVEMSRAELAARIVGNALNTNDDFVLNTFIALGQLSPDEWKAIKSFVDRIKGS